jgi:riboflavin kinase/FMN adenylyltransferase
MLPPVFRNLADVPRDGPRTAVTIGNFDGVHTGHRRIFRRVVEVARHHRLRSTVVTFDPHPAQVVAPQRAPRLLTTPEQRAAMMGAEGIEQVVILPFDVDFSKLTPEEFAERVLAAALRARFVLVGENFRFGNRQAGDAETLRKLGSRFDFDVEIIGGVVVRGRPVSSTAVRRAVETGNVAIACRLLSQPFALEGEVVRGHGIGSKQTVPTLNLAAVSEVLPATGVYITTAKDLEDGRTWPAVTNVGYRPTFDGNRLTVETYLLRPLEGRTPSQIRVEFRRRLRDERKFADAEALKAQIVRDAARAEAFFRRLERWSKPLG